MCKPLFSLFLFSRLVFAFQNYYAHGNTYYAIASEIMPT